jgi:hypothetical protein
MNNNDSSNDSRNEFNKHYDAAINDILFLKDCNISTKQINEITSHQIDFIHYVINMYKLNKDNNNNFTKSIKITAHNINVDEIKKNRV